MITIKYGNCIWNINEAELFEKGRLKVIKNLFKYMCLDVRNDSAITQFKEYSEEKILEASEALKKSNEELVKNFVHVDRQIFTDEKDKKIVDKNNRKLLAGKKRARNKLERYMKIQKILYSNKKEV